MLKHKRLRDRGKTGLSKLFAEFNKGDKVALVHNLSFVPSFPWRFNGLTGQIIGKQGKALVILVKDGNKEKKLVVQRIHLKKLSA